MEATPREISCKHKAIPPNRLEPLLLEGNNGANMIPQERRQTKASEGTRKPVDKIDTT